MQSDPSAAPAAPTAYDLNKADAADVLATLDKSPVPGSLKEDLRKVLKRTLASTNGYTEEQKVAAIAQGLFDLTRLFIYTIIHDSKKKAERTWKDVVVECRVQICILAGIIASLFIVRPELANIAYAAAGHPPAAVVAAP